MTFVAERLFLRLQKDMDAENSYEYVNLSDVGPQIAGGAVHVLYAMEGVFRAEHITRLTEEK